MNELTIQTKTREMMTYAFSALRQFPKSERFVLAAEIRQCIYKILRLTIVASKRYHKKTTLQDLDVEVTTLRDMVRIALDLRYIDMRRYEIWQRHIAEIGKMVGGWIKSIK
ncbi:diversity-generating retroelement protein Avd [Salinivibrio kushneri]|uniref:diversity-generating retroelement protein Avd n=1 Tax=Salinivibrio kushneri TaxID=1908198 RepID=UPI0009897A70|nr:diversity-generating retroelement protein Avd [Salinivibrio kushneri]OOE71715.1 four helix bundle protein [Salinivibrio kushneri]